MTVDVLIVGAGMAGTGLAFNLARQNIAVTIVDRAAVYPDAFRAEKIEAQQAVALRKLHMFEHRVPPDGPIGAITKYRAGVEASLDTGDQYGIAYGDTVNSLRRNLLGGCDFRVAEVVSIRHGADVQTVTMRDGTAVQARLVVLATGGSGKLLAGVGMRRRYHRSLRSLNIGFDVHLASGAPFPFTGYNYHLQQTTAGVDYVTLFRIGERMRANVFTQWSARNPDLKLLGAQPKAQLLRHFPDLETCVGPFNVGPKVQFFKTECYRVRNVRQPGVVVVADEFQSVSPATGTGLSKLATDIDILANELVPAWLSTPGMDRDKIAQFYDAPRKRDCDDMALIAWVSYRDRGTTRAKLQWYRVETRVKSLLGAW